MTQLHTCPDCGLEFRPKAMLKGLCPGCLLGQVVSSPSSDADVPADGGAGEPVRRFRPPKVEELQAEFTQLEILELVGHGGMSAVYKARQTSVDRVVALKILPLEVAQVAGGTERFARETRTLARLNHPNIVTLYDAGQAGPWCYIVMEFIDGPNLRQLLGDSKLSAGDVLKLVPDICDGLQYAHDQGVVHRDIKPENVLLDSHSRAKITDFGLARLLQPENTQDALTATRQVMGTPHYIAPELFERPGEVDNRADLYSLGVMIYEMLTGELPVGYFDPPSRKAGSHLRLDEIVMRALAKDPSRRYQQARDVRDEVLSMASEAPRAAGKSHRNWGRFHELFMSAASIAVLVFGVASVFESLFEFSYGGRFIKASQYLVVASGLCLLSVVLCRVNVSRSERWPELSIAQWLAAPILIAGYLFLGIALALFPGIWMCAYAVARELVKGEHLEAVGQSVDEFEPSFQITRYWVAHLMQASFWTAAWTALTALVCWRWPAAVRLLFHPTGREAAKPIAIYLALLVVLFLLPFGICLLIMDFYW